tara:strand:+ start:51 stop:920 length:870 start_codon:yes stop_codon:yes gene_type:complete
MTNFSKGKYAQFISDRSGMAFPYKEMVVEWNGARVHISEYEPKQPQLQPKPVGSDPQGLPQARPARVELPTADFLPTNPFTAENVGGGIGGVYSVSHPDSKIQVGDFVRLMTLESPLSLSGVAVPIQNTELTTTLSVGINATATSLVVTDPDLDFYLNGGFIMIEKVLTSSDTSDALKIGTYQNEIIQYTGYNNGTKTLSGLTRGTNAVFRGVTPGNTIAGSHLAGAKVIGARIVTALNTTTSSSTGQPSSVTNQDGYQLKTNDQGSIWVANYSGGGNGCQAGPLNVEL